MNFSYEYDNRGNITSETRNDVKTTYAYDALGQLTRVNDPNDTTAGASGTTWVYEYDLGGNILKKSYYVYTTAVTPSGTPVEYVYNYDSSWKDKLMSVQKKVNGVVVSGETKTFAYNDIGNPTTYDGWTCEWEGGRQLKKMVKGSTTIEFKYNHNGLRTHKIVTENGVTTTTEYILHGKLITHLTKRVVDGQNIETVREELHFFYDSQSKPAFVEYNGAMYRYVHNLQGDIVAIVDTAGNAVVEYKYDAWGKNVSLSIWDTNSTTLASLNPYRYRWYVWDEETSLYYLRSRYYCSEYNRMLSEDRGPDRQDGIFAYNAYAYCKNMPVNNYDQAGTSFLSWLTRTWETICYEVSTFFSCVEFEAGAGGGIGIGVNIYGVVELEAYAGVDIARLHNNTEDNTLTIDQSLVLDLEASAADTLGASVSLRKPRDPANPNTDIPGECDYFVGIEAGEASFGLDSCNDVVYGFGGSVGVGIGAHFSIGFNATKYSEKKNASPKVVLACAQ